MLKAIRPHLDDARVEAIAEKVAPDFPYIEYALRSDTAVVRYQVRDETSPSKTPWR